MKWNRDKIGKIAQWKWQLVVPWAALVFFAYLYFRLAWLNEAHLRNGLDLGIFHQAVYVLSEGRLPYSSLKEQMIWGDHASFILAPLALIYRVMPDVRTLLAVQALALVTSAWPLWRTALTALKSQVFAAAVLVSYLGFFGVQYALDFDFHPAVFTAAALAWALFAVHHKKYWLYGAAVAAGLLTQEDAAPVFAMIGVWLLLAKRYRTGGATLAAAIIYFVTVVYFIMPQWTPNNIAAVHFDVGGETGSPVRQLVGIGAHPWRTMQNMTDTGDKARTLKELARSYGYIQWLTPFTYLTAAPNIVSRFLSSQYPRHQVMYHYNVVLAPLLAYGAILGAARIKRLVRDRVPQGKKWQRAAAPAAAAVILAGAYVTSWRDPDLPLWKLKEAEFTQAKYRPVMSRPAVEVVRAMMPAGNAVAASSGLVPALAGRKYIYNFPNMLPDKTRWIVLSPEFNTWPLKRGEVEGYIEDYKNNDEFELVMEDFGLWVFRQKDEAR
jgi:uncharacterized membrane protein